LITVVMTIKVIIEIRNKKKERGEEKRGKFILMTSVVVAIMRVIRR